MACSEQLENASLVGPETIEDPDEGFSQHEAMPPAAKWQKKKMGFAVLVMVVGTVAVASACIVAFAPKELANQGVLSSGQDLMTLYSSGCEWIPTDNCIDTNDWACNCRKLTPDNGPCTPCYKDRYGTHSQHRHHDQYGNGIDR